MKSNKVLLLAKIFDLLKLSDLGFIWLKFKYRNKFIRVINYHSTPEISIHNFDRQLNYFKNKYTSVNENDLENFFKGNWNNDKPGLIISFDDGIETNYKFAKEILEKNGFAGWFFVPSGLIGSGHCKAHHMTGTNQEKYMTWDEVSKLSENHVIGAHTVNHIRLKESLSYKDLKTEIIESKFQLENILDKQINSFCWVGGENEAYSLKASDIIKNSDYKFSFLTNHYPVLINTEKLMIERTNIEANWPLYLVKFYMSPFMDLIYLNKRNRIRKLLK